MKRITGLGRLSLAALILACGFEATVHAASPATFKDGIFAGPISLSGLTQEQAHAKIEEYVKDHAEKQITLVAAGDHKVVITAEDLGIRWKNEDFLDDAIQIGTEGNVIQRYKAMKDLSHDNKVYDIELEYDHAAIDRILTVDCCKYDQEPVDAAMVRKDGEFTVTDGQIGYALNVESSASGLYTFMKNDWDGTDCRYELNVEVQQPKGMAEDLYAITDVLGTFTTDLATSNANRIGNVTNGCNKLNGVLLYPGEELSVIDRISPFTVANGYALAGAYSNGKVIDSVGGGICQVSTTLYNAVLLSELDVTERHNHSMTVSYVKPAEDAAIASSAGKDFRFVNNTDYPIYVESYVANKKCVVTIYGKETRPATHSVRYENEILQVINPSADSISADASKPIGYIYVEGAHIGYKSRLWKIVTEDGVEVSRDIVNTSNYKVSPRSAVVGVATGDPQKHEEIMAAIGTYSIDHVRNVIAILTQPAAE